MEYFPSCTRCHYNSTLLMRQAEPSNGSKLQHREEKSHPEGLSYFVQHVEQRLPRKESDVESTIKISNSGWKKSRKVNLAQKAIVQAYPLFFNKNDNMLFNFQHSASPDKILKEYVRLNIYSK